MTIVGTTGRDELTGLPQDLVEVVLSISQEYEKEDRDEREEKRPLWLKLENYFDGFQRRYWDAVRKDWRVLPDDEEYETSRHYDKVINIYRAHAESIIAALSTKLPSAVFYPEDADVIEDLETAKVCVKIKKLVERHNNGKLLLIRSLMYLFNTGLVAAYIYNRKNSSYGTYQKPIYSKEAITVTTVSLNCAECGSQVDEIIFKDERGKIPEEEKKCEVCGYNGVPVEEEYTDDIPQITGYTNEPKSRTAIEVFSPLFVHIPLYARSQELCPYIRLKFEQHYSLIKDKYPNLVKKQNVSTRTELDADERGISLNAKNLVTVECLWVRGWGINIHEDKEKIKKLREKFPDGFYCVIIDGQLCEIHNENLDDHWEISVNPLSEYLHAQPLGKPVAPIQDLKNEVVDLQIETFEHAIPETHARADVVDFKKYAKSRATPGMVYPAMTPSDGSPLGNAFHTIKTATLSEESDLFNKRLDNEAQFVLGSFPSIYGGPATSGSKTAREYEQSRTMALQRLGTTWKLMQNFWTPLMGKAVQLYIKALKSSNQDEKFVEREPNVGFINIWLKQSELEGKIGRVEPDVEEDLPQTANQLKDVAIQLLTMGNEDINEAMMHPQNAPFLTKILGAPEFFIPGSDSRDKQYAEFSELVQGIQVEVDIEVENHTVEGEVCETFLNSSSGQMLKKINFEGWSAIKQHRIEHFMADLKKQQMITEATQSLVQEQSETPAAEGAPV